MIPSLFILWATIVTWVLLTEYPQTTHKQRKELPVEITYGPGAENGFGPKVTKGTMSFIVELVIRESKGVRISFPIDKPFLIKGGVKGMLSYSSLDSSCKNEDIAFAASITTDSDTIYVFDQRVKGNNPLNIEWGMGFPYGIQADNLYLDLFDDMCHETNLRLTFVASGHQLDAGSKKFNSLTKQDGNLLQQHKHHKKHDEVTKFFVRELY
ncbi:MAG: hypothetical protein COV29_00750 [Candidatus Yanofskybacteria bacterium CG10_big_fil_rev_8_21_14_0_10_36_16]|uniref:Uncharacterized protein n=1 Tax=Candidatus Yanofskybacteria bacterium CG10_big_fil_rev_8_21_14_0_10_36_16 TaxID=1975096 RepID=A0A2J0QBM8_9BACT|nr:MAG: hypothetical protein COV29_00750 [Candidatus Yanofskybacteria bacterium CG10_big_fil_rev_8_21_14_0_10_36_16]